LQQRAFTFEVEHVDKPIVGFRVKLFEPTAHLDDIAVDLDNRSCRGGDRHRLCT